MLLLSTGIQNKILSMSLCQPFCTYTIPPKRLVASAAVKGLTYWDGLDLSRSLFESFYKDCGNSNTTIPREHPQIWKKMGNISSLSDIPVPRHHSRYTSPVKNGQLHLFTEPSLRLQWCSLLMPSSLRCFSFLTANARVAPVKPQTMPKLELLGARQDCCQ